MIRKTGIKVLVERLPYGAYTATPVSRVWRDRLAAHMKEYLTGYSPPLTPLQLSQAFFQGYYELPDTITQNRQYPELCKGWDIVILVDPWEFGHWLGYDAHTVAERSR